MFWLKIKMYKNVPKQWFIFIEKQKQNPEKINIKGLSVLIIGRSNVIDKTLVNDWYKNDTKTLKVA